MTQAVSTFDELSVFVHTMHSRTGHAEGELADLIRAHFDARPEAPVRLSINYDNYFHEFVLTIDSGDPGTPAFRDLSVMLDQRSEALACLRDYLNERDAA